jgi:hypothetical protein
VTTRLGRRRSLDRVLTEFGLSPHPRLVVVLEGATEMRMWARMLSYYDPPTSEDLFSLVDAQGAGKDLGALVAYIAPRTELVEPEGYLPLMRPPTRFLVVTDPEGRTERETQRAKWISRLLETQPPDHRTPELRAQLELLVFVETWNRAGDCFEFANFTDRQIAPALRSLPGRQAQRSLADLTQIVSELRAEGRNLRSINRRLTKPALADELWPVLEQRLAGGMPSRVPIARIFDRALELAGELPRRNLLLHASKALRSAQDHSTLRTMLPSSFTRRVGDSAHPLRAAPSAGGSGEADRGHRQQR